MKWVLRLIAVALTISIILQAAPPILRTILLSEFIQSPVIKLSKTTLSFLGKSEYPEEILELGLKGLTKSLFDHYYIFVGVTNSAESRPGGGLLTGYVLVELHQLDARIITTAANETFGRVTVPGFENFYEVFGPTVGTFFDSTLIPDVEVTSAIVSEHFLTSIGFTPDLYIYIDNEALIESLGESELASWLEQDQYQVETIPRNTQTRKLISSIDRAAISLQIFEMAPKLLENGQLRVSDLEGNKYDVLNSQAYSPETLLLYSSNSVANKLDTFIEIKSRICRSNSNAHLTLHVSYKPPRKVWGYQAGYSKKYMKMSPPPTSLSLLFMGDFELGTVKNKAESGYSREGFYIDRNWRTFQIKLDADSDSRYSFEFSTRNLKSFTNLSPMSNPKKKSIRTLESCS